MANNVPSIKTPKRITTLSPFEDSTDPNDHSIEQYLYPTESAGHWHMAIDYKDYVAPEVDPTDETAETPVDYGTKRIPMSRVVFRDENGLIPPSMLPEYVDDVAYGKFVPRHTGVDYAEFQTVEPVVPGPDDPDPEPGVYKFKYRYPYTATSDPCIKDASEYPNLIWMDTYIDSSVTPPVKSAYNNMQFIFHEPGQTMDDFCGFTALPSTKVITSEYGITVNDLALTTDIAVKTPEREVTTTTHGNYQGGAPAVTAYLGYLRKGVTYMITVNLVAHPDANTLSDMIEDFVIHFFSNPENNPAAQTSLTFEIDMSTDQDQHMTKTTMITLPAAADGMFIRETVPTLPSNKSIVVDTTKTTIEIVEVI